MLWLLVLKLAFDENFATWTPALRVCPHHVEVYARPAHYADLVAPACDFLPETLADADAIAP